MHAHVVRCCGSRGPSPGCGCGSSSREHHHYASPGAEGGGFGVRRPLRFLAWRLQLDEGQVAEFAKILSDLKTERAQGDVDDRRSLTAYADALSGESFDEAKARAAAGERVKSLERIQTQVVQALVRIHALLQPEQREKFAYLIRTGAVVM